MFGAVIGYEGLITKNPVNVYIEDGIFVFDKMNSHYFQSKTSGLSTDGCYTYFISETERDVLLFIEGIKTAFKMVREVIN